MRNFNHYKSFICRHLRAGLPFFFCRLPLSVLVASLCIFCSCERKEAVETLDRDEMFGKTLVINELMASNRTGLADENGKLKDWIEVKNISSQPVSLQGYSLKVDSLTADSVSSDSLQAAYRADGDSCLKSMKMQLPDVTIASGECKVFFLKKNGKKKGAAGVKLPKEGGRVRLLSDRNTILSELQYEDLSADQSFSRQPDGSFQKTYFQSPGFDNTPDGYNAYCERVDAHRTSPVLIWELAAREDRRTDCWVEVKNVSDSAVSLMGYSLNTKDKRDGEWAFPDVKLESGQLLTIRLAGKKATDLSKEANVKLSDSETLVLMKDGKFVDGVCAKAAGQQTSVGRCAGQKGLFFFRPSTPAEENGHGCRFIAPMPVLDKKGGVYNGVKELTVSPLPPSSHIRYTTDGSVPTSTSPLLSKPLRLTKSCTVRAYAEGDANTLGSDVFTTTYILNQSHTVAVVNVTMDANDLYSSSTGIYANGPGCSKAFPHLGANFWKRWERDAHVEMFDGEGGFSLDCGIRIFGGYSRGLPKKSFLLKFRNKYGQKDVTYDFFGTGHPVRLEEFVLRSGSQDYDRVMLRDEYFTSLMAQQCPTLLVQAYRPVALYVNAEYFGLYYIREKVNADFVARHLNVPDDSITIVEKDYAVEGRRAEYDQLLSYISTHDMSQSFSYAYVRDRVDLESLIDFKVGQYFACNNDVGNIRLTKSSSAGSDNKWYHIFYDLDSSWEGDMPVSYYLDTSNTPLVNSFNIMIHGLLRNKEFRALMQKRVDFHLQHTLSEQHAVAVFDSLVSTIRPEMKLNCQRWPQLTYEEWERNVVTFRKQIVRHAKTVSSLRP